jgi:hypothetical protein
VPTRWWRRSKLPAYARVAVNGPRRPDFERCSDRVDAGIRGLVISPSSGGEIQHGPTGIHVPPRRGRSTINGLVSRGRSTTGGGCRGARGPGQARRGRPPRCGQFLAMRISGGRLSSGELVDAVRLADQGRGALSGTAGERDALRLRSKAACQDTGVNENSSVGQISGLSAGSNLPNSARFARPIRWHSERARNRLDTPSAGCNIPVISERGRG